MYLVGIFRDSSHLLASDHGRLPFASIDDRFGSASIPFVLDCRKVHVASRCISFEWHLNSWRVPPRAAGRALVNGAASRLHPSGFDRSRIHALLRSRECLGAPPLGARQEQNPDFRGINGPPTARERAAGSPIYSTFGILFLTLAHPAFATWQRCSSSCTS